MALIEMVSKRKNINLWISRTFKYIRYSHTLYLILKLSVRRIIWDMS